MERSVAGVRIPLLRQNSEIVRKGDRVVEGTGLENRRAVKRTEGSNPSPSAKTVLLKSKNRRFVRVSYFFISLV